MVDLMFTAPDGKVLGMSAEGNESSDIYSFISESLSELGITDEEINQDATSAAEWCKKAKPGSDYTNLNKFGIEISAYDKHISAKKADEKVSETHKENNSVLEKLQQLSERRR